MEEKEEDEDEEVKDNEEEEEKVEDKEEEDLCTIAVFDCISLNSKTSKNSTMK